MADESKSSLPGFELTDRVLGEFYGVYNELGPGFPEFVYRRALVIALQGANIDAYEHMSVPVWFRGVKIVNFQVDVAIPSGPLLLEVKAAERIDSYHVSQTLSYLKSTEIEVGLILNFGKRPEFKRLIFENSRKKVPPGGSDLVESSADREDRASADHGDRRALGGSRDLRESANRERSV